METRTEKNDSAVPGVQAKGTATVGTVISERTDIKEPAFVSYGCLGCLVNQPAGHCLHGNEVGDEFCQRDRKLNTRATSECIRKGCISAMYLERHTLVCTHTGSKCHHIDRHEFSYGELIRTRDLIEVLDSDKCNEALRVVSLLKAHRTRPVIEEVPC